MEAIRDEMIAAAAVASAARAMVGPTAAAAEESEAMSTTASSAGSPPRSPLLAKHQPGSIFEGFGGLVDEPRGKPACSNRLLMHSTARREKPRLQRTLNSASGLMNTPTSQ